MKTCGKCLSNKKLTGFNKDKTRSDGLAVWCKICAKQYNNKWRNTAWITSFH